MYRTVRDFLNDWSHSVQGTLRVLQSLTDEKLGQAIVEGHNTLGWLGWHLANAPAFFMGQIGLSIEPAGQQQPDKASESRASLHPRRRRREARSGEASHGREDGRKRRDVRRQAAARRDAAVPDRPSNPPSRADDRAAPPGGAARAGRHGPDEGRPLNGVGINLSLMCCRADGKPSFPTSAFLLPLP